MVAMMDIISKLNYYRHTDAWWTGVHTVNGKCGWFQVNNTQSDITPLDSLKHDIKQKYTLMYSPAQ